MKRRKVPGQGEEINTNVRERSGFFGTIIGFLFSRIVLTAIVLVAQMVYALILVTRFVDIASWIGTVSRIATAIVTIYILVSDENPAYKIGWIVIIAILPESGVLLYLIFGEKRASRSLRAKVVPQERKHYHDLAQVDPLEEIGDERMRRTASYVATMGPYAAHSSTTTKYYDVGDRMFEDLFEDLRHAQHFIFIEYFIIGEGLIWEELFSILKEKAAQGLDVRIIYDDFGSARVLPKHFRKLTHEAGIHVMAFNTVKPFLSLVYNNRDHRKITVIDGYIGYSGGANIADEYANVEERFGHWKDCGIRLYGEAVWNLTVMFLNMWNAFKKQETDYEPFSPHVYHPGPFDSDGMVQPFSDSPLDNENVGENVYFELINQAKDYLYIFTPYLILDNEMETQLRLAAKRGVDVRLITPGVPDKKIVYAITRSYYRGLLESGVRIYEYTPGFLHSKCFLCDDKAAVVGTINIDYRSFYLHFECGALLFECSDTIADLKQDFRTTIALSERLTKEGMRRRRFATFFGYLLRILTPLM